MKKIAIVIATLALAASAAFARQGPPPTGTPGPNAPGIGEAALFDFLGLTADQETQWTALHDQFRTSVQTLFEQRDTLRQQLQDQLDATTPDPAAIGATMLQLKGISDQIRAAHDALQSSLEALLTPDQLLRFQAFLAAQKALGRGPGGPNGPGAEGMPGSGPHGSGNGTCIHC